MVHDATLFRNALTKAGFDAGSTIWNDKHKDGSRRLKLWYGNRIFEATATKQKRLETELRNTFGDRIITMYFVSRQQQWHEPYEPKSLCIQLTH